MYLTFGNLTLTTAEPCESPPNGGFFRRVVFQVHTLVKQFFSSNAFTVGAVIGALLSVTLFLTVPAYQAYIAWTWTSPWMWILGAVFGLALIVTDK